MDKDKTIRVSDEVMKLVTECKDNTNSLSVTIAALLDKYESNDFIVKKKGKFLLVLNLPYCAEIEIPVFTPVNKIIRISTGVYNRLQDIQAYPDESFNMILFRLTTSVVTKPYILRLGKLHSDMLNTYRKYSFEAGVGCEGEVFHYELPDIVNVILSDANESSLIARYSGEVLKVWSEPFPEHYEWKNRYDVLCPDRMAYICYICIADYERKIAKDFTLDIAAEKYFSKPKT